MPLSHMRLGTTKFVILKFNRNTRKISAKLFPMLQITLLIEEPALNPQIPRCGHAAADIKIKVASVNIHTLPRLVLHGVTDKHAHRFLSPRTAVSAQPAIVKAVL